MATQPDEASATFGDIQQRPAFWTNDGRAFDNEVGAVRYEIDRISKHIGKHFSSRMTEGIIHHGDAIAWLNARLKQLQSHVTTTTTKVESGEEKETARDTRPIRTFDDTASHGGGNISSLGDQAA